MNLERIIAFIPIFVIAVQAVADSEKLAHVIRFNDYEIGSEEDWLLEKGFKFNREFNRGQTTIKMYRIWNAEERIGDY